MKNIFKALIVTIIFTQISQFLADDFCRDPRCAECSEASVCKRCKPGYNLDNNKCLSCTEYYTDCLECSPSYYGIQCTSCKEGFFATRYGEGGCYPRNCQSADERRADCLRCVQDYTYSNRQCIPGTCPQVGCAQCGRDGCIVCKQGFAFLGSTECKAGSCADLYPHCGSCDPKRCTDCEKGYYMDWKNYTCLPCSDLYPNSSACTQSSINECQAGFIFDKGGYYDRTCVSENCDIPGKSICKVCKAHFNYDNITRLCSAGECADSDCARCGSEGCNDCYKGYTLFKGKCQKGECSDFYPNCVACDRTGCIACNYGFSLLKDGTCFNQTTNKNTDDTDNGKNIKKSNDYFPAFLFVLLTLFSCLYCSKRCGGKSRSDYSYL